MCPVCMATVGLYVAGGLTAGAGTTLLATRMLRKQPETNESTTSIEPRGDEHAATDDRIER